MAVTSTKQPRSRMSPTKANTSAVGPTAYLRTVSMSRSPIRSRVRTVEKISAAPMMT
jgi:hypothetical protein